MIDTIIHIAVLLLLPPLLLGVITKTKAWFGGRVGAPLLQPYYDLAKLMRRGVVLSTTTTWVFQAGPMITLATVLLAGLLIPISAEFLSGKNICSLGKLRCAPCSLPCSSSLASSSG